MKNLAAGFMLLIVSAVPALGQWTLDAAAGFAAPTSSSGFRPGLDLMGAIEQRPFKLPLAVRLEVGWDRLVTRTDLDAIFDPSLVGIRLRPYLLAGFGLYNITVFGHGSTNFGINMGGGLRYPVGPVQPFFEVRYHVDYATVTTVKFIPLQFGVRIPFPPESP